MLVRLNLRNLWGVHVSVGYHRDLKFLNLGVLRNEKAMRVIRFLGRKRRY